ncbi:MAG: peptidylprolyl isomerase [Gallionella sp.]|nr:peptidylprolyl isomerase [Gallionella sp.]
MSIKSRILLASAVSLLVLSACNSKTGSDLAAGDIAATVNGTPISKYSVDQIVGQRAARGQPDSPETRKAIIDQLAITMLASEEAIKKNLDKTPEVSNQINLSRQSILANAYVEDYIKNHPISDDMLKAEYDKVKAQMSGTEYKARHILVDKEALAKTIIAKLKKNPKLFDSLARQYSKDPGSKSKGGELGWFDPRGMVPEFGAAVAKLKKGKFTLEPVKTQFGYHVILLEDTRAKEAPTFEQVKPQLAKQLQQQSLKKLFDDMKENAKIVITDSPAAALSKKPE